MHSLLWRYVAVSRPEYKQPSSLANEHNLPHSQ
jgi:hypothetical protein